VGRFEASMMVSVADLTPRVDVLTPVEAHAEALSTVAKEIGKRRPLRRGNRRLNIVGETIGNVASGSTDVAAWVRRLLDCGVSQKPAPANVRLKLETRALFGVLIFLALIAAGIECVEHWRYSGQAAYEGHSSLPDASACAPSPIPLPVGHAYQLRSDTTTGACLLRVEGAAPAPEEVVAMLDLANAPECEALTQYWRLDTDFWCTPGDNARGGCRDDLCVWRAQDAATWFARWHASARTKSP
jgi:hypothetical protein